MGLIGAAHAGPVRAGWTWLTGVTSATALHAIAIWVWHIPRLLDATLIHEDLHRLQHVCFLATALLFWWAVLRGPRRLYGLGALHAFLTMMHTSLLGALLALAPHLFYPLQTRGAPAFGLTPMEDQQLAGLVMWAPGGVVYMFAGLGLVAAWPSPAAPRRGDGRAGDKLAAAQHSAADPACRDAARIRGGKAGERALQVGRGASVRGE
jgi:cytochrome c oxidase assembly factor CtaG